MIKPLTSFRFFFALAVLSHHTITNINRFVNLPGELSRILDEGFIGVGFFFILSGFVLCYSYENKILTKTISKKDFYISRIARIYPMHLLTLLIVIIKNYVIFSPESPFNIGSFFLNLFLLQSFVPIYDVYFSFNSVSWSLSDEMFFYCLFPLIIPLLAKLRYKLKTLSIIIMAGIVIIVNLVLHTPDEKFAILYICPIFRIFDFILGIYICQLWNYLRNNPISKINFNYAEVFSVILMFAFIYLSKYVPLSFRYSVYYWIPIFILLVTFAFQKGYISKLLSNKLLVLLGEASFCFYLIHQMIVQSLKSIMESLKSVLSIDSQFITLMIYAGVFILIFVGMCLISIFLHKYFEKPLNKYIKNTFTKPAQPEKLSVIPEINRINKS